MASERSLFERIDATVSDLGALVEEMAGKVYTAIEGEELKRLAIEAGVDHTSEGTVVLREIGARLQHERDVNRELRRRIAALEGTPDDT